MEMNGDEDGETDEKERRESECRVESRLSVWRGGGGEDHVWVIYFLKKVLPNLV